MRWLALLTAVFGALANLAGLLRDRRVRQAGWDDAVAAGRSAVDEREQRAVDAAARARADGDLLRDDGHRRD